MLQKPGNAIAHSPIWQPIPFPLLAMTKRILILAANPRKTARLRLDEEVREIEDALHRAKQRDQFERPIQRGAVTPRAMQQAIVEEAPHIVHFSGHGEGEAGIVLEDINGQPKRVSTDALATLFSLCEQVECIILNACYSAVQAQAIAQHVPYVIGMKQAVGDRAAIEFAVGFYGALGAGQGYDKAYSFGCSMIRMADIPEAETPQLAQPAVRTLSAELPVTRIALHGWDRVVSDEPCSHELDWTPYFEKKPRRFPDLATWERDLVPHLEQLKSLCPRAFVDLRSTLPLSAMLAFGFHFSEKQGYCLQIKQQSQLWRSDAPSSDLQFEAVETAGQPGDNLLIALSISRQVAPDIAGYFDQSGGAFDAMVYAEPELGTGHEVLQSASDVTALAKHARTLIEQYRAQHRATRTHLILVAPHSFALFLGMQLNALGELIAYERTEEGSYQPMVRLQTG